jgi:cell division protein FtsL
METTSNRTLKSGIDLLIVMLVCITLPLSIVFIKLDTKSDELQNSIDFVNVQIKKLRVQLYNADTITHKPNSIPNNIKRIKYE